VHLGDAAAEPGVTLHLREHVDQKQHLAVAGASYKRAFGIARVLNREARVLDAGLPAHAV